MKFRVMAVSEEEYRKADADPSYVPKEYCEGHFLALSESHARRKLKDGIEGGIYPRGSQIVECEEDDE